MEEQTQSQAPPGQEQQAPANQPAPQKEAGFSLSKDEWLDLRREIRQLKGRESAPSPDGGRQPTQSGGGDLATVTQRLGALESELQFERAIGRSGLAFNADQRSLLESAFYHQKPESTAVGDWIAKTAATMGVKPPGQTATPMQVPADPPRNKGADNNTGPPSRAPEGAQGDPAIWAQNNPQKWAAMDPDDRNRWIADWRTQTGTANRPIEPAHVRLQKQRKGA